MARTLIRPGGRSERIQIAVHGAVRDLMAEEAGQELSIALIAARAEVPPSTIYRRWQTLPQLLADVANHHFVPDAIPPDTGSFRGDLAVWVEQAVDDFSSGPMHALFRERLTNVKIAQISAGYTYMNLLYLCDRCQGRGEPVPDADRIIDLVFAPIVYRIFFTGQIITKAYQLELVDMAISSGALQIPFDSQTSVREYAIFENDPE
jgi:AcrR family transcriptional regulator